MAVILRSKFGACVAFDKHVLEHVDYSYWFSFTRLG